jgi:hypothetical protein
MTNHFKLLTVACLGAFLLPAAYAQGGAQSQPADPTAQSPTTPAQTTPPTFPEPAPTASPDAKAPPSSDASSTTQDGTRIFTGSIAKHKSGFVLKAGNNSYKLDDQSKAKEYKGKNVQVTGSLDKSTNTIHVEKIEASASM